MSPQLEQRMLALYRKLYGCLTAQEALDLAEQAEKYLVECGPYDPAYSHFVEQRDRMLAYAALLDA